jgi:hypothetical protein
MNIQINNPQTATISIIRQIKTKLIPKDIIWSTIMLSYQSFFFIQTATVYLSFLLMGDTP